MGTFMQDLRFAVRSLLKAPAFPLAAIATLALGIGATTAIFSTLNAVLLKPLPYPNAEDLYSLRTTLTDGRVTTGLLVGRRDLPAERSEARRSCARPAFQPARPHAAARGRHAAARQGLRRDRGLLRAVRSADDAGRLHARRLHAASAAAAAATRPAPHAARSRRRHRRRRASRIACGKSLYNGDPADRRQADPLRGSRDDDRRRRAAGLRHAARRATSGSRSGCRPDDVNHGHDGFMRLKPGTTLERAKSEMATVMDGLAQDFPASDSQPRLRDEAARRLDRRRSRADPRHRHVGDGPAAPAGVRERHEPAAGARRGAGARDGRARVARRRPRADRAPAADRVGAALHGRRRARRRRRVRGRARAAGAWARRSCRGSTR